MTPKAEQRMLRILAAVALTAVWSMFACPPNEDRYTEIANKKNRTETKTESEAKADSVYLIEP